MLVTHCYLLRPTAGQHARLAEMLEMQRQLYNAALEERIGAWRASRISITRFDQTKSLTTIRAEDPHGYGAVAANVSRWTLKRVDDAFQDFFGRVRKGAKAGFPRYRTFARWRSFGLQQWSGARISNGFLVLKGMDRALRVSWHRRLPIDAVVKGATFTRKGRRWFVALQIETDVIVAKLHAARGSVAGVDAGVQHLVTWDDGTEHGHAPNARIGKARARAVRVAQRALGRCRRGSRGRDKVKARLARLLEQLGDARATHLHVQSENLARRFETIAVEKLQIANLVRSAAGTMADPGTGVAQKRGLNRAIHDASMGRLFEFIRYKAERAGGTILMVSARNTSQVCSGCGVRAPKALDQRTHTCVPCALVLQRDVNAARNIRARGLAALAAGGGVVAPGELNVADCRMRAPRTPLAARCRAAGPSLSGSRSEGTTRYSGQPYLQPVDA